MTPGISAREHTEAQLDALALFGFTMARDWENAMAIWHTCNQAIIMAPALGLLSDLLDELGIDREAWIEAKKAELAAQLAGLPALRLGDERAPAGDGDDEAFVAEYPDRALDGHGRDVQLMREGHVGRQPRAQLTGPDPFANPVGHLLVWPVLRGHVDSHALHRNELPRLEPSQANPT